MEYATQKEDLILSPSSSSFFFVDVEPNPSSTIPNPKEMKMKMLTDRERDKKKRKKHQKEAHRVYRKKMGNNMADVLSTKLVTQFDSLENSWEALQNVREQFEILDAVPTTKNKQWHYSTA